MSNVALVVGDSPYKIWTGEGWDKISIKEENILSEDLMVKLLAQPNITIPKWVDEYYAIFYSKIIDVNVIVPNKVVECLFADGTKTKAVCREPDVFSLETAIGICVAKKVMGGSSQYNKAVKHGIKVYENLQAKEKELAEEQERIEKRKAKRKAYMERRAQRRADAEKERQIEIQKEAYIRAMEYMNGKDTAAESK